MLDVRGRTAIAWLRVSTEGQDKQHQVGGSKDEQLECILPAARDKGVRIIKQFDVTETATKPDERHQFNDMVQFVKDKGVEAILVKCIDRLSRSFQNAIVDINTLVMKHGVALYSVESDLILHNESTPQEWDRFYREIIHADIAGKTIGWKTKNNLLNYAKKGRFAHKPANGYKTIIDQSSPLPDDKKPRIIIPVPEKAPLIKWAFESYAQGGWSDKKMRDELNLRGLRSGRGNYLNDYDIHIMLTNRFYAGEYKWKGLEGWQKGNYEPLVSKELFEQVQAQRKLNRCSWKSYERKPKNGKAAPFFIFRHVLKCGECGCSVTAAVITGTTYYRCTKSRANRPGPDGQLHDCPNHYHREDELMKKFEDAIGDLVISEQTAKQVKEWILKTSTEEASMEEKKRRSIENQIALKKAEQRKQFELLCSPSPILTEEEARPVIEKLREEINHLEAEERKLSERNYQFKDEGLTILELLRGVKRIYQKANPEGKAAILNVVLDHACVFADGAVEFFWTPVFQFLFDVSRALKEEEAIAVDSKSLAVEGR